MMTLTDTQLDHLIKALLDGATETDDLATRTGIAPEDLSLIGNELERGKSLIAGFWKFAHENMKPTGLPPPCNPYLNPNTDIDEQSPEYYAFEAVQRGNTSLEKCLAVCRNLGIDPETAQPAIENVCIPWRETNGWRSYVRQNSNGTLTLMDKTPVKLKRPLDHLKTRLMKACQDR